MKKPILQPAHLTNKRVDKFYRNKMNSSRARKIAFELSMGDIRELLKTEYCAYTGIKLTHTESHSVKQLATDFTLERVDCSKGYTKENTIAVCHAANAAKNTFEQRFREEASTMIHALSDSLKRLESGCTVEPVKNYNMVQKAVLWIGRKVGV